MDETLRLALELQALKKVNRENIVGGRPESSAEHSWGLALLAVLFHPMAEPEVDPLKAVKMALVHDICEIGIGDRSIYEIEDPQARQDLERANIGRLLEGRADLLALWEEFEARRSPEARFVLSLDKLEPVIQNMSEEGAAWRAKQRGRAAVLKAKKDLITGPFKGIFEDLLDEAVERGFLKP